MDIKKQVRGDWLLCRFLFGAGFPHSEKVWESWILTREEYPWLNKDPLMITCGAAEFYNNWNWILPVWKKLHSKCKSMQSEMYLDTALKSSCLSGSPHMLYELLINLILDCDAELTREYFSDRGWILADQSQHPQET